MPRATGPELDAKEEGNCICIDSRSALLRGLTRRLTAVSD